MDVRYKLDRRLVGDRTAKSRLSSARITESQFADDVALYSLSRESFEKCTTSFITCTSEWGLTVSLTKTKGLVVGGGDKGGVNVRGGVIEVVEEFTYLGSVLNLNGGVGADVKARIAKASRVFGVLLTPIFHNSSFSLQLKRRVYEAVVIPTLLYGAETWALMATHLRQLNVFHHQCTRSILGVSRERQWEEKLTSRHSANMYT